MRIFLPFLILFSAASSLAQPVAPGDSKEAVELKLHDYHQNTTLTKPKDWDEAYMNVDFYGLKGMLTLAYDPTGKVYYDGWAMLEDIPQAKKNEVIQSLQSKYGEGIHTDSTWEKTDSGVKRAFYAWGGLTGYSEETTAYLNDASRKLTMACDPPKPKKKKAKR